MAGEAGKGRGSTVDQLRDDIDSGRTASKVPANDPAAAPLGTDEEAAGTSPTPEAVEAARRAERSPAGERDPVAAVGRHGPRDARNLTLALGLAGLLVVLFVAGWSLIG